MSTPNEASATPLALELDLTRTLLMNIFRCLPAETRQRVLLLQGEASAQRQVLLEGTASPISELLSRHTQAAEERLYRALQESHRIENQLGA